MPFSAETLLRIWEEGASAHPLDRALLLLRAGYPEVADMDWAFLPIGRRDAWLIRLQATHFARYVDAQAACPACASVLEFTLEPTTFLTLAGADDLWSQPVDDHSLRVGDCLLHFRLPHSRDLAAIVDAADPDEARQILARRCLERMARDGDAIAGDELPAASLSALAQAMDALDPLAEIGVTLTCPECAAQFTSDFDVADFMWTQLSALARRLLEDVHRLAWAYGWSERAILTMSGQRRRYYLELIAQWPTI